MLRYNLLYIQRKFIKMKEINKNGKILNNK